MKNQLADAVFSPPYLMASVITILPKPFKQLPMMHGMGSGQHQDGVLNYSGQQVTFFQNNTEVAIPFLSPVKTMAFCGTIIP